MRIFVKRENWEDGIWMRLPATKEEAEQVRKRLEEQHVGYGRECLENLGVDCSDPAFERFSFFEYGMEQYEAAGMKLTAYGSVSLDREPELSETQEDDPQMGGCACQTM